MKKIIIALFLIIFVPVFAFAEVIPHKVPAVVLEDMSYETIHKGETIELMSLQDSEISQGVIIKGGDKINLKILKYNKPKRGKRDGYFLVEYINNNSMNIKGTMRVSTPKDMESVVENIGVGIAGHVLKVPGFSQAVAVSKGLLKPSENKSRLASAGQNLYQSTPLTYVEKGKDFIIEKDGIVILKLKENTNK